MADETPKKGGKATITSDDNVKFLISCINYSSEGKINWKAVADQCGIVSHGAAAKRYERLLKAHGIEKNKPGAKAKGNDDVDGAAGATTNGNGDGAVKTPATPKLKTPRVKKTNGDAAKTPPVSSKRKVAHIENEDAPAKVDNSTSIFGDGQAVKGGVA